jgi:drug/metabolite transporter (DMT)-like permease
MSGAMSSTRPLDGAVMRGIACIVLAMALFAVLDALIKWLSAAGYSTWQLVFCRSLFAFVVIVPLIGGQGGVALLRTSRLPSHLFRACFGLATLWCWFYSYRELPLADAYALSFSAPLFMTALSGPLLGERVGRHRWSAVVVGLAGVIIMVQPGATAFEASALIVLLAALLYALSMIQLRGLGATEPTLRTVFYFTLFSTLASGFALPLVGRLPASWLEAGLLVATGLIGGVAQVLLTHAYRLAPVSIVAPFDYTAMVWAVLLGLAVFGDRPGWPVLFGAVVVIASGLYILRREALKAPADAGAAIRARKPLARPGGLV